MKKMIMVLFILATSSAFAGNSFWDRIVNSCSFDKTTGIFNCKLPLSK